MKQDRSSSAYKIEAKLYPSGERYTYLYILIYKYNNTYIVYLFTKGSLYIYQCKKKIRPTGLRDE